MKPDNKKRQGISVIFAVLFSLFSSCALVTLESITITFSINEYNLILPEDGEISLVFDKCVDRKSIEDNFSLTSTNGETEGTWTWQDNKAVFKPIIPLVKKYRYTMILDGEVKSEDHRFAFKKYQAAVFYFCSNEPLPAMNPAAVVPQDAASVSVHSNLVFGFTRPMDRDKVMSSFSFSPAIEYEESWNADDTIVTLVPKNPLMAGRIYTWQLSTEASDKEGTALNKAETGWFMTTQDLSLPEISFVSPADSLLLTPLLDSGSIPDFTQMGKSVPLLVEFSKDMDLHSVRQAASFSPAVNGIWQTETARRIVFIPSGNWKMDTDYLLRISTAARDENNISLRNEYKFSFKPEGIALQKILTITLTTTNDFYTDFPLPTDIVVLPEDTGWNDLSHVIACHIPESNPQTVIVTIDFAESYDEAYRPSVVSAVSFNHFFPEDSLAGTLTLEQVIWPNNKKLQLVYSGFQLSTTEQKRFYKFEIRGTEALTLNQNGSFLNDNCKFYFEALE